MPEVYGLRNKSKELLTSYDTNLAILARERYMVRGSRSFHLHVTRTKVTTTYRIILFEILMLKKGRDRRATNNLDVAPISLPL